MLKAPDRTCVHDDTVYICINDNEGGGEVVGPWVGTGGVCCEVGALEWQRLGVRVWRRRKPWLEECCHSLGQEGALGLSCGTEERESVSQGTEGIYFGDLKE